PWLRSNYGYQIAFLFPAGLMTVALTVFALGKRFYAKETIERKVLGDPGTQLPDGKTVTGLPVKYKVVTPEEKAADRALKLQTLGRIGSLFLLVMFFWAIFDQSASTWIFFADTYMDCHLFGFPVTADQIQSANALFIVTLLPLSVIFFNWIANRGRPIRATETMIAGFVLPALPRVIMSPAGFMAGAKQAAVKLTTPQGVFILDNSQGPLADVKKSGSSVLACGGVRVSSADFEYDAEKKKLSFTNG